MPELREEECWVTVRHRANLIIKVVFKKKSGDINQGRVGLYLFRCFLSKWAVKHEKLVKILMRKSLEKMPTWLLIWDLLVPREEESFRMTY